MTNLKNQIYIADRPVKNQDDDKFQRYNFSKRIADTIKESKNIESLVIGIFGAWGEGKSSVLNFIDNELKTDENIIRIYLNPWRYTDEETLLISLFKNIANTLGKELETKKEKIGSFIKKYGSITQAFGIDISSTGGILNDSNVDIFKERVNELLLASKKRVVIFVDDIDRLDKNEIFAIFRIVKLTADFSNTIYILSFDDKMVAEAIGERFGSGSIESGESFLEKIIQVPINIPKAQPEALKKFCFLLVENAINSSKIELSEEEIKRFVFQFSSHLLSELDTPRLAARFGNAISFALPLLKGEINTVDLLLIEAIKIFYPKHYRLIKNESEYFIGDYNGFGYGSDEDKKAELRAKLDELSQGKSILEKNKIRYLLTDLFPKLDSVYSNYKYTSENNNEWYIKKKICSTEYFQRYFSYTVIEGDVSDIEFEEFLSQIKIKSLEELGQIARKTMINSKPENYIQKLRSKELNYTWEEAQVLSKILCELSDLLPSRDGAFYFGGTLDQAAIFILQTIENHKEKETYSFAKELMVYPKEFRFAYSINNWLRKGETSDEKLYTLEQYQELAKILTKRAVKEAGALSIFQNYDDSISYLIHTWVERDKNEFIRYIKSFLNKRKQNVIIFLEAFVPLRSAISGGKTYKMDINKETYEYITSIYDKDELIKKILDIYKLEVINKEEPYFIDISNKEYSYLNMCRQFYRWYVKKD